MFQKLFAFGRAFCFIILVSGGKMSYNIKVWNRCGVRSLAGMLRKAPFRYNG